MNDSLPVVAAKIRRLLAAIEDGEILRVRYNAGSQAGTVRDIRPSAIIGNCLRAFDEFSPKPKSFILESLDIEGSDEPLTYVGRRSTRRIVEDPLRFTDGWAFHVPMPAFATALDIAGSQRTRTNLKTQKKERYLVWTQGSPPEFAFEQGDLFHAPRTTDGEPWEAAAYRSSVQIISAAQNIQFRACKFEFGRLVREVVCECRPEEFVELLRHGREALLWGSLVSLDGEAACAE